MKKRLTLFATITLLTACTNSSTTPQPLQGDWVCMTNYAEAQTQVLDNIRYQKNGQFTIEGVILSPIEKPLFAFKTTYSGTWSEQENQLNYQIQAQKVERAHAAAVQQIIAKEEKVKQLEAALYQAYSSPRDFSGLTIKSRNDREMLLTQTLQKQLHTTACMKKEEIQ